MERSSATAERSAEQKQKDAFRLENIETLRSQQQDVLFSADLTDAEKTQRIEELTDEYADDHGIEDAEQRQSLRAFSADKIDEVTWRYGDWIDADDHDKGLGPIGRDVVHDAQTTYFGKRLDIHTSDDDEDSDADASLTDEERAKGVYIMRSDKFAGQKSDPKYVETDEEKSKSETDLDRLMHKYSILVAERSKSMIEGSATRQSIDKAKEEASDLLSGIATRMMDELEAQGKTPDEIAAAIDAFINIHSDKLTSAMEAHRMEEYDNSNRFMKRIYDTWAKWTEESTDKETGNRKFFSKGTAKKLAATTVVALPVGFAAGALIPVAGLTAGGIAAAGVGVAGFRSIGRSLAGGFLDRKSQSKKLAAEQRDEMRKQYQEAMARSEARQRQTIFEVVDERSDIYRKRNLTRAIAGTAVAAAAGMLGGAAGTWAADKVDIDAAGKAANWVSEKARGIFGNGSGTGEQVAVDLGGQPWADVFGDSDSGPGATDDTPNGGSDSYTDNGGDTAGDLPTLAEQLNLNESFAVEDGHGYTHELIQAAKANGIDLSPEQAWELHKDLVNNFGTDYIDLGDHSGADVYSMGSSDFDTGISAPSQDATWSPKAQDFLAERFVELNPDLAEAVEADTATTPDAAAPAGETTPDVVTDFSGMSEAEIVDSSQLEGLEYAERMNADWADMKTDVDKAIDYLRQGNITALNADPALQNTLEYVKADLAQLNYKNSDVAIISRDVDNNQWVVNPVPKGASVPYEALKILEQYKQSVYALAA